MQPTLDSLVFWAFVLGWAVVLGMLVIGPLPSILRDGRRIVNRVIVLVDQLPLRGQVAKAQRDLDRMQLAVDSVPALRGRLDAAVMMIQTAPLLPPAVRDLRSRIGTEISAFRGAVD